MLQIRTAPNFFDDFPVGAALSDFLSKHGRYTKSGVLIDRPLCVVVFLDFVFFLNNPCDIFRCLHIVPLNYINNFFFINLIPLFFTAF